METHDPFPFVLVWLNSDIEMYTSICTSSHYNIRLIFDFVNIKSSVKTFLVVSFLSPLWFPDKRHLYKAMSKCYILTAKQNAHILYFVMSDFIICLNSFFLIILENLVCSSNSDNSETQGVD